MTIFQQTFSIYFSLLVLTLLCVEAKKHFPLALPTNGNQTSLEGKTLSRIQGKWNSTKNTFSTCTPPPYLFLKKKLKKDTYIIHPPNYDKEYVGLEVISTCLLVSLCVNAIQSLKSPICAASAYFKCLQQDVKK